ncbi:unnamed protein product [Effrenium voratum]|uniref:Pentatricopeptide repeat-containing protein n=1 Tax=Effrenium voratum TaxID=2562239 RepID=A0AA36J976_9DINO|nr:unnamed protein product [Effrenium voratum]
MGVQPNVVSFNAALANTPGQHTAELLALMARRQVRPSGLSFGAAMGACERSSHWRHALDLLSTAKTFSLLETSLVKAVVRSCRRSGQWQRALSLLEVE